MPVSTTETERHQWPGWPAAGEHSRPRAGAFWLSDLYQSLGPSLTGRGAFTRERSGLRER